MLTLILNEEEEHVDVIDRHHDLIKRIGIEKFTQLNAAPAPDQA